MPKPASATTKRPAKTATKRAVKKAVKSPAVAAHAKPSVQQDFLDELVRNRTRVSIFLVNGVKLEGEIKSYDRYVIIMRNAVSDKIYKHAVSTIMPAAAPSPASDVIIEKRVTRSPGVRRTTITRSSRD